MTSAVHCKILILDFGAQDTQLIARRLRETNVYCEIHPYDVGDAFVREFGGPDGDGLTNASAIKAAVKELLKNGTMELVPVDESIPTGEENKDAWIFSVWTDGQGNNGIWAIIDRKTGDASVTNFN